MWLIADFYTGDIPVDFTAMERRVQKLTMLHWDKDSYVYTNHFLHTSN